MRRVSTVAQCSSTRIHPTNNAEKAINTSKKNRVPMTKISALRMKHTNDMRALAALKADHAAKNSEREVALRVRIGLFVASVLGAFGMLGAYFASVIAFSWVLVPVAAALVLAGYINIRGKQDKKAIYIEKKKIVALQKKIASSKKTMSTKSFSKNTKIVQNSVVEEKVEQFSSDELATIAEPVIQTKENIEEANMETASKWTATRKPTPLYARTNTRKQVVKTDSDLVDVGEESQIRRPKTASPVADTVTTDQLVANEVRFDLEDILRSRRSG